MAIDPGVMRRLEQQASLIRQLQGALGGLRIVRGLVGTTGTVVEGTGYSAARNGTGDYTITYDTAFSDRETLAVFPGAPDRGAGAHASTPSDGTATRIQLFTASTGANTDESFHFIAIGPA